MKVNTDGVLLGAWAALAGSRYILDVGTGTGTIALMAAQRCTTAIVHAIDIHEGSAADAAANAANSLYTDRLEVYHRSLQEHCAVTQHRYDHIISNPPYFTAGPQAISQARATARHTDTLSHEQLVAGAAKILTVHGKLSLIIPSDQAPSVSSIAASNGLHTVRKCDVWINENQLGRVMVTYQRQVAELVPTESILIRMADGQYSDAYRELTADFYLKL